MVAGDHDIVARRHLAARHQQHVTGCPANLHRDQVAFVSLGNTGAINRLTVEIQSANCGCRSAEQQADRAFSELVDRGRAAVRLHQQDWVLQAEFGQLAVERAQVSNNSGCKRGIHHSSRGSLILPHEGRNGC